MQINGIYDSLINLQEDAFSKVALSEYERTLSHPNVQFVFAGQQIGILTGPALTIYKALSAVAYAEKLELDTGVPTIPVFWMQTEDHDLKEISELFYFNNSEISKLSFGFDLESSQLNSNRRSVSDFKLSNDDLAKLSPLLSQEHYQFINDAKELRIDDLFEVMLSRLLANRCPLILNPRKFFNVKAVQEKLSEVFLIALDKMQLIDNNLLLASKELENEGGVKIIKNSPLFFYHPHATLDQKGERYRFVGVSSESNNLIDKFEISNIQFRATAKQLKELILNSVNSFSTSALLRPIVQDSLFNTAAFLGGVSELNYHRQLVDIYPIFGISQPKLVERAHVVVLDKKMETFLHEEGLSADRLELEIEEILSNFKDRAQVETLQLGLGRIEQAVIDFKLSLEKIDKSLNEAFLKTSDKFLELSRNMLPKAQKSILIKDESKFKKLSRAKKAYSPLDKAQERVVSGYQISNLVGQEGIDFIYSRIKDNYNSKSSTQITYIVEKI